MIVLRLTHFHTFSYIFIQWIFVLNFIGVKCLVFFFLYTKKNCEQSFVFKNRENFKFCIDFVKFIFLHKLSTNWHRLCFDIIFLTLQIPRNNDVFQKEKNTPWFSFYCQEPWITADEMYLQMHFFSPVLLQYNTCFYALARILRTKWYVSIDCATRWIHVAMKSACFFSLLTFWFWIAAHVTCTSKNIKCARYKYISKCKTELHAVHTNIVLFHIYKSEFVLRLTLWIEC